VEALTDNRNRTASDVRHAFDKFGGNLGATGCVSWQFDDKGVILLEKTDEDEDEVMLACLEAGADDVETDGDAIEVYTDPDAMGDVREALEAQGRTILSAEKDKIPQTYITLSDEDALKNMQKMLDMLEDNDDVQNVWHNWEE